MRRTSLAVALLAISWLPGLGYYHPADLTVWALAVLGGVALLLGATPRMPSRPVTVGAIVVLMPAIAVWPWPYRAIPILLAAGLALAVLPIPRDWPKRLGGAAVCAGAVLLAQAAAAGGYEAITARSHDLPSPLADLLGAVAWLLGQDSAVSGGTVSLFSMRQVHRLGATWELLLDPPTLAFLVGGIAVLMVQNGVRQSVRPAAALIVVVLAWLPIRAGVLMGLLMHRTLVTDYDAPLVLMNQFWSAPVALALLAGPAFLAWRFVRVTAASAVQTAQARPEAAGQQVSRWRRAVAVGLVAAAGVVLTASALWDPAGDRKAGRVLVDEFHSKWEPTDRPMDTEWYGHLSGYNYYCAYDYCSRFYDMGRLTEPLTDAALAGCDVLLVKVPTEGYKPGEIEAVRRWVDRGGGLVLIGEHTDVFHTGENLNALARNFGFEFRYDCVFGMDKFFEQLYEPPLAPHPIIQRMPPLDFAISCSIAPGASVGRAVIRATGLKNAPADYHATNFYPQAEDRPDMRYGAFVQLWATRCGKGRVVAFTDSTQFSNFSMFEPGKPELLLGMIEWANRCDALGDPDAMGDPQPVLAIIGLALAAGGIFLARRWSGAWALLVAAAVCGHAVAATAVREGNLRAMPQPPNVRPYTLVVTDRTVSEAVLPTGGFIAGNENGFGIFERWILRLGYFTGRAAWPDLPQGDLVVVLDPSVPPPAGYVDRLAEYVKGGGRLLVLDSARNAKSTADSLLWPFGLEVKHDAETALSGELTGPEGWPRIPVEAACAVTGGQPLATVEGRPVAAAARYGDGLVIAIGFSWRFTDANMGVTGDVEPDAAMRAVYEVEFQLLRAIIENRLPREGKP